MRTTQRKLGDFRFCTVPIGSIAVVSIIYKSFMGQNANGFTQYAYPAKAGIKYAD